MSQEELFQNIGAKTNLVDQVVENIQTLIVEGRLAAGERLPPEREFADQIGVSRTVLREAVRILSTKGLLETRHGVGTVVRPVTNDQLLAPLSLLLQTHTLSVEDLHQVRSILEVGAVRLAAHKAQPQDLAALHTILAQMAGAQEETVLFVALDDEYHNALVCAAHNPLLVFLSGSLATIMHEVRVQVHDYTRQALTAVPDHSCILAAIEAQDAEAAAAAMQQHLDNALHFQRQYLVGVAQPQLPAAG